jgi:Arc/MetJ-type ribon-helix-helix transcriptional regulator
MFQSLGDAAMYEEPKMEKITINLPPVEIARMDILIEAGYYPNRTEFIRTAVRRTLDVHQDFISNKIDSIVSPPEGEMKPDVVSRRVWGVGVIGLGRDVLERAVAQGEKVSIHVVGMLIVNADITPDLVEKAVESVKIYGILRASPRVRKALQRIGGRGTSTL